MLLLVQYIFISFSINLYFDYNQPNTSIRTEIMINISYRKYKNQNNILFGIAILFDYQQMNKEALAYLQHDQIGKVVAKGLATVYTQQPKQPIKYLAHWLKSYSQNQKQLKRLQSQASSTQTNLKIYESNLALVQEQQRLSKISQQKHQQKINKFKEEIQLHEYQQELLDEQVCEFLQKQFNFTGVYIGELNYPKKKVTEEDTDENAHLDTTHPRVINYVGSSLSHKDLMLEKTLSTDKGVTSKAFQLTLQEGAQQVNEDGSAMVQQKKQKCIYIPNVVKNQNMHYFRLPKLGAYVAVPLVYNSYLKQSIFDTALTAKKKQNADRQQFQKSKQQASEQLQAQKQEIAHRLNDLKQKNAEQGLIQPVQQQIAKVEERLRQKQTQQFQPQKVSLPVERRQYVVCADTLGSDKVIPQAQRQFIIDFVLHFKDSWEKKQYELLYKDVQTQIAYESKYLQNSSVEDVIAAIEAQLQQDEDEQTTQNLNAIQDQTLRNYRIEGYKINRLRNYIKNNEKFVNSFEVLKQFRVLKFKQLIRNILYFQGKRKSQINLKDKACINWKSVRMNLINKDLFSNVLAYVIEESKSGEYPEYAKINSIIQKLQSFSQNQVFHYNIGLALLKKFIQRALRHRINNIELRKVQRQNQRQKREQIILENQKISQQKTKALQNHKATLPAEQVETFSQEQWSANYDKEHPLLEAPAEVVQDVDNDF